LPDAHYHRLTRPLWLISANNGRVMPKAQLVNLQLASITVPAVLRMQA
jgi:hypothetical protein